MVIKTRDEFDRGRDFVAFKPLVLGGKIIPRGQPFDKTKVTARRLRQLFDQYMIDFAQEEPQPILDTVVEDTEILESKDDESRQEPKEEPQGESVEDIPPAKVERVRTKVTRVARRSE